MSLCQPAVFRMADEISHGLVARQGFYKSILPVPNLQNCYFIGLIFGESLYTDTWLYGDNGLPLNFKWD